MLVVVSGDLSGYTDRSRPLRYSIESREKSQGFRLSKCCSGIFSIPSGAGMVDLSGSEMFDAWYCDCRQAAIVVGCAVVSRKNMSLLLIAVLTCRDWGSGIFEAVVGAFFKMSCNCRKNFI